MMRMVYSFVGVLLAVLLLGACGRSEEGSTRNRGIRDNDPVVSIDPVIPEGPIIPGVESGAAVERELDIVPVIRWGFNPMLFIPENTMDVFAKAYDCVCCIVFNYEK